MPDNLYHSIRLIYFLSGYSTHLLGRRGLRRVRVHVFAAGVEPAAGPVRGREGLAGNSVENLRLEKADEERSLANQ